MMQSGYTAAMGIAAQQKRVDNIAANLANLNTTGYKATKTTFKDALYNEMQKPVAGDGGLQKGSGILVGVTSKDFSVGAIRETGKETDFMIKGDGFFMIQDEAGQKYYTRDGGFSKSVEKKGNYLVGSGGRYVLDPKGKKISLPTGSFRVEENGKIFAVGLASSPAASSETTGTGIEATAVTDKLIGEIGVVRFKNNQGLEAVGSNLYGETAASGAPVVLKSGTVDISQKSLEGANVDLASEFVSLIRAQKALSFSSRALRTADEMDATANALR